MKQLTLDKAAESYSSAYYGSPIGSRLYIYKSDAFKAGAKWQKEQYKRLIELIKEGCPVLLCEGLTI